MNCTDGYAATLQSSFGQNEFASQRPLNTLISRGFTWNAYSLRFCHCQASALAQVHKFGSSCDVRKEDCLADVETQAYAKFFGEAFAQRSDAPIQFLTSWQVELPSWIQRHATLEQFVEGTYQKYTNNSVFIADGAALAEAFCHFTYCHSGR